MAQEKFVTTPEDNNFTQPNLWGLEAEQPKETELANCLVLALPVYKDTGKRREWSCALHAQPSILQPDTDMELIASASHEVAAQSQRNSLKPGDRVALAGIMRADTLLFPTGERKIMYHLALTQAPQMVVKEKRVSTTIYEQWRERR